MIEVTISPQDYILSDLLSNLEVMGTKLMPKTFKAVKMASKVIAHVWKLYAMGAPIGGSAMRIKKPTGEYAKSIKIRQLTPFSSYIYSDSKIARALEEGTKPYDMKKTHPFGKRSRVSGDRVIGKGLFLRKKKGVPYLIIPFRHGIPGTLSYPQLPVQVYAKIRQEIKKGNVQLSRELKGKKRSPNYMGELIPRSQYQWGSKISSGIDNLEGMVVMDVPTNAPRSAYVTFRIISVNSPAHKWLQPGRPAMKITKHVVENTREIIKDIIGQGLKQDLGLA